MTSKFTKKIIMALSCTLLAAVIPFNVSATSSTSNSVGETSSNTSQGTFETVDLNYVKAKLNDQNTVIVDTRRNDAFIGWKIDGAKRGGHIKEAKDFAANWLKVENEKKEAILEDALKTKGITSDKEIILYDLNNTDAKEVYNFLSNKGFSNVKYFNLAPWIEDESLELVVYPEYKLLVPPSVLKEITEGKKPESFENAKNIKIVEGSWGEITGPADSQSPYAKGHIKGAPHINTDTIEPPPAWMLADDETLIKFANAYGFSPEDTVIVTGKDVLASYRVFYVLRYLGIKDVRILNGGTDAWVQLGYPLDTETTNPVPADHYKSGDQFNKDFVTNQEELKTYLQDKDYVLVDIRTWKEYIGEDSGYSYHNLAGRIPGAIFGYAGKEGEGSSSVTYFENIDKTMRNGDEIVELWKSQNINLEAKRIDTMCGSGWRAAEVTTFFNVLGYDNVKMYSDGWIGWSLNPENKDKGIKGQPEQMPKYLK